MLPKKRRIGRKEFGNILSKGKRYNSPNLLLYISQISLGNTEKESKFSFSVSKKVSSLATNRNKYRRRGYSVILKHISSIKPGFLFFFSFKKGSFGVSFSKLEKEIVELLSEAHMLS